MIRKSQSPAPAVDDVPVQLAAARDLHPCVWATPRDNARARLPRAGRHLRARASIKEIPCLNEKPDGPARGVYRGPATRVLLPGVYADLFAEAKAECFLHRTGVCEITAPCSVKELWENIAGLVPQGRSAGRRMAVA
jgi:hypothetical protein